jgi:hypothetical protein
MEEQAVVNAETRGLGDTEMGGTQDAGLRTQDPIIRTQDQETDSELERLRGELAGAKARHLEAHRRALLAENAGKIVPELVIGSTIDELDRSVEVARQAFDAAKAAAIAELAAQQIPAGNPIRQGPNLEGMSPFEKIAYGLKRE